jgi:hypothetical protein
MNKLHSEIDDLWKYQITNPANQKDTEMTDTDQTTDTAQPLAGIREGDMITSTSSGNVYKVTSVNDAGLYHRLPGNQYAPYLRGDHYKSFRPATDAEVELFEAKEGHIKAESELRDFKALVKKVAIKEAQERDWCSEISEVLRALGIDPTVTYAVSGTFSTTVTCDLVDDPRNAEFDMSNVDYELDDSVDFEVVEEY